MLLTRKTDSAPTSGPRLRRLAGAPLSTMDRRTFLKRSGPRRRRRRIREPAAVRRDRHRRSRQGRRRHQGRAKRTVCTHCSVGCAIDAIVVNGVWTRQEPVFDSPLNLGAHCAKGASVREHGIIEHSHRLKTPMKLVDGK